MYKTTTEADDHRLFTAMQRRFAYLHEHRFLQRLMWSTAVLLLSAPPLYAGERGLLVSATAYNSIAGQTNQNPTLTAWGDRLRPGMKVIAVSHDLVEQGLKHKTPVRIDGLEGEYLVLDRMPAKWHKKIDIYMGDDVEAAKAWGKRKVKIYWRVP